MKRRERFFTIFTLGVLSAMGAFSIDMYLPGFPDIAKDLHTTIAHITLSITSFFYWHFCRAIGLWPTAG